MKSLKWRSHVVTAKALKTEFNAKVAEFKTFFSQYLRDKEKDLVTIKKKRNNKWLAMYRPTAIKSCEDEIAVLKHFLDQVNSWEKGELDDNQIAVVVLQLEDRLKTLNYNFTRRLKRLKRNYAIKYRLEPAIVKGAKRDRKAVAMAREALVDAISEDPDDRDKGFIADMKEYIAGVHEIDSLWVVHLEDIKRAAKLNKSVSTVEDIAFTKALREAIRRVKSITEPRNDPDPKLN